MSAFPQFFQEKRQDLVFLCQKYQVLRLYVFGSVLTDRFNEKSDIDFLVSFDQIPLLDYADYFFDFIYALEKLFARKIDLLTEKSLSNPYLIQSINRHKQLLYDRKNQVNQLLEQ